MSRRGLTLLVAGIVVVAAAVAAAVLPVPYVVLSPGPTLNTLGKAADGKPLIAIQGHRVHPTSGHLNMVTVSFQGGPGDEINIFTALRAWLAPHDAVVPQQEVFPAGLSQQQVQNQDLGQMADSQQVATAAALTELGIPYKHGVISVVYTEPGMPAARVLRAGDIITGVDSVRITSLTALTSQIQGHPAGSLLRLTVRRGGATLHLSVRSTRQRPPAIGVSVIQGYQFPFPITIRVGDIGGPSAGLMFALGIIDKLGPVNLTGGRFIAGTGEISQNGTVGPIGGIQQKMSGARAQGATVFLVPAGNCGDAIGAVPAGMRLIRVSTLAGAVHALEALRAGRPVPSC